MNEHYPFELAPLPYPYNALEPCIDQLTVAVHHDRHLAGYVKKLNAALKDCPSLHSWSLEQLLCNSCRIPECIRTEVLNNAGGVWSHELYFDGMTCPEESGAPCGELLEAIDSCFGCFEHFQDVMTQTGLKRFGSGWAWLVVDKNCKLCVLSTHNQDVPLADGLRPILALDVWEHAYYLKYLNKREDYVKAWWNVVDWAFAGENYCDAVSACRCAPAPAKVCEPAACKPAACEPVVCEPAPCQPTPCKPAAPVCNPCPPPCKPCPPPPNCGPCIR